MRLRKAWLLIGCAVPLASLLAGCGVQVSYVHKQDPPFPMPVRGPDDVEVLEARPDDRPFVEVGILTVEQRAYNRMTPEEVLAKLQWEAGRRRCEGLVLLGMSDRVIGTSKGDRTLKGYRGACLVFKGAKPGPEHTPPGSDEPAGAGEPVAEVEPAEAVVEPGAAPTDGPMEARTSAAQEP
jgi:hypothetical protein